MDDATVQKQKHEPLPSLPTSFAYRRPSACAGSRELRAAASAPRLRSCPRDIPTFVPDESRAGRNLRVFPTVSLRPTAQTAALPGQTQSSVKPTPEEATPIWRAVRGRPPLHNTAAWASSGCGKSKLLPEGRAERLSRPQVALSPKPCFKAAAPPPKTPRPRAARRKGCPRCLHRVGAHYEFAPCLQVEQGLVSEIATFCFGPHCLKSPRRNSACAVEKSQSLALEVERPMTGVVDRAIGICRSL